MTAFHRKAANDAIPGEVISAKISRMELLVDRIFDRVEQNPDSVNDMRRMMDYYLPTTMKLLEAYEELDAQPVQGENIISSKKEIEDTIDTLNLAFEKLLDSLFQDTAWDVFRYFSASYNACSGRSDRRRAEKIMISQTDNESKQLQTEVEDYYE